jgi:hypothetical protein
LGVSLGVSAVRTHQAILSVEAPPQAPDIDIILTARILRRSCPIDTVIGRIVLELEAQLERSELGFEWLMTTPTRNQWQNEQSK